MRLETAPFDPGLASPEELRAWHEIFVAVSTDFANTPVPPYESYVQQLCAPMPHYGLQRRWDARADGRVIGTASAMFPTHENRELAIITVRVPSRNRRQGVGTRLLRAILPEVGELGRRTITGTVKADADGEKWANALGLRSVLRRSSQHLDIPGTDPSLWQVRPAPGFRLHQWLDTAPSALVHGLARARDAMADRPMGDATYEHPSWTAERVRQYEAKTLESGDSHRYVVAVDERSGAVAGFTEIAVTPGQLSYCRQEDTAVLPEYRGLGLGRAMKAAMMRWLTADLPRMEQVRTMTASENLHMIRVNTQLGYRIDSALAYVEAEVGGLSTALDSSVRLPVED
ncbi:GNAT family N-acetyltransferase [Streptacidiphilus sp. PB12-B1b]|uniref:GNAT family N-acetyltransferase n=1 Tax=Streptacidiphilus sp. PB12-B1b TaxID=2705012 RepID=UPI0015F7919C|nr:GNAT family N-acetyltransferase [Streptacidiphilus sp. PB12-B1b]QMU74623.1 GNAT family N-acetyltransferase [Streptacidiphilus sp. PB12-B1b]